jgi:hypothetical protein
MDQKDWLRFFFKTKSDGRREMGATNRGDGKIYRMIEESTNIRDGSNKAVLNVANFLRELLREVKLRR